MVNNSKIKYSVYITYTLLDKDGFELVKSKGNRFSVLPGETKTYQKEKKMDYFDYKRVSKNRNITISSNIIKPDKSEKTISLDELLKTLEKNNPPKEIIPR